MSFSNGLELVDPQSYATQGYPHETWARLRRESPVHLFEPPGWRPAHPHLGTGVRARIKRRQSLGSLHGLSSMRSSAGTTLSTNPARAAPLGCVDLRVRGRSPEVCRGDSLAGQDQREVRQCHADRRLVEPDLEAAVGAQAFVDAEEQHGTHRERVAVHGGEGRKR